MTAETVIVAPELIAGGVGDHTRLLLQNLPRISSLRLIVPKIGGRPLSAFEEYPVQEVERNRRDFRNRLPRDGGKVFVQYSAYGFSNHGYPRWLIETLMDWKQASGGLLVIMFHEIWAFWPIWNRNYILQFLHRRDLGRLLGTADAVLTSTPDQGSLLTALSPRCRVQVLPVGSNVPRVRTGEETREPGLALLFGLQSSRLRTLRRMFGDLKALSAAGVIRRIITLGGGRVQKESDEELALLAELDLTGGFDQIGPLPAEKVSELLQVAMLGISSQDDRSVFKSSSLMACAAHGLNIVSCYADTSKPEPLSLMISPDELMRGVSDTELVARGEKLRRWQERTSSWPEIARQVASALEL